MQNSADHTDHANHARNSSTATHADFGFADVAAEDKTAMVGEVFSQVAPYYDCMNDLMSVGMHRLWKRAAVLLCNARPGMHLLDLACGSGDLAKRLLPKIAPHGQLTLADINENMLASAKMRIKHEGVRFTRCNGESLPFANGSFDRVIIGFGLRNITHRQTALAEMHRVLRPGGLCLIMEFSPPSDKGLLATAKRHYLTSTLPCIGDFFYNDAKSYRYLGESILRFPSRQTLVTMMQEAGFGQVQYFPLAAGAVCIHRGRNVC